MRHRFLVGPQGFDGDHVAFAADQAHQIRSVLRLRAGDRVLAFDGITPRDRLVELIDAGHARVVAEQPQAPEPATRVIVYPALLQRDKFETILQKLTELGVAAITPVITARGLVRQGPDERREGRWASILREAAEQSGRGVVPRLLPALAFSQALDNAPGRLIVAYEGERAHELRDALRPTPTTVSLFTGPEGGFASEEVACVHRAGAHSVTLGPRVLRAETAALVLTALVLYELGDLSSNGEQ
ncbi:MAG TPA: RsmE family RNA methyltransferase [Chloroflexota bacterium]